MTVLEVMKAFLQIFEQIVYSDAFRPLIPIDSGHLFRSIPAGYSDPFRPPP